MLEDIDFTIEQINQMMLYIAPLVDIFSNFLIESTDAINYEYGENAIAEKISSIIKKIDEIEFIDEYEIIVEAFKNFVFEIQNTMYQSDSNSMISINFQNSYFWDTIVHADIISTLILNLLLENAKMFEIKKPVLSLGDALVLMRNSINEYVNQIENFLKKNKININNEKISWALKRIKNRATPSDELLDHVEGFSEIMDEYFIELDKKNINAKNKQEIIDTENLVNIISIFSFCIVQLQAIKS